MDMAVHVRIVSAERDADDERSIWKRSIWNHNNYVSAFVDDRRGLAARVDRSLVAATDRS